MLNINVTETSRVDALIAKNLEVSRSFVNVLLDQGKVFINDKATYKSSTKVHGGDVIMIDYQPAQITDIPDINLPILYEDDDCLVIEKPVGVLTHSKGAFNPEATVSTFIRPYTTGMQDNRGGIVHRLDRVTSGLIICAKNQAALDWLQSQFADRKTKKTYVAVVQGIPEQPKAMIDLPIERNPKKPQTFRVGSNGKTAKTLYKVLKSNEHYSLLELQPETGRTHQLRVHLSHIKHPIVGDLLYGGEPSDRVYLHAHKLEVTLPNKTLKTFISSVPETFDNKVQ